MVIKIKQYQLKNILIKLVYPNQVIQIKLKDILNKSDTENSINNSKNFTSSLDNNEEHVMHSKSDDIEIIISGEADEVIKQLFDLLKNRY